MEYLAKRDYLNIIANSLNPSYDAPEFYFYQLYLNLRDKDAHFIERLRLAIQYVEEEVFNISTDEFGADYDWQNHHFYFDNGKIIIVENNNIFSVPSEYFHHQNTPRRLLASYDNFVSMTQSDKEVNGQNDDIIKLNWKGQKNQLYSVIRQLKIDHEMLDETYEDLAKFIKQSFNSYSNTKVSTIEKELKKDTNLPENLSKKKRLPIDPNKD